MRERSAALGIPLAEAALLADRLHPDARAWILAETLGIPFLEVEPDSISLDLAHLFPEALARENRIVPIAREGDRVTVAVTDPFCHGAFAVLEEMTGLSLRMVVCPGRTIGEILARFYPDPSGLEPFDLGEGSISREEAEKWLSEGGRSGFAGRSCSTRVPRDVGRADVSRRPGRGDRGPLRRETVRLLSFPLRFRKPLFDAFLELAGVPEGRTFPPRRSSTSSPGPGSSPSRRVSCAVSPAPR